jgi:hypothetical protein
MITPRWVNQTVAIVASGPSLLKSDVDKLKGKVRVIAVNDSWRLCPWADVLYAADRAWWQHHAYVKQFEGERWTQQQGHIAWRQEATDAGLDIVVSAHKPGVSFDPSIIHTGNNSGFQALNLAVLFGATKILLLGIDCAIIDGKTHWFGDHPGKLKKNSPYAVFLRAFKFASTGLASAGINVVNCSQQSALTCFQRGCVDDFV